MNRNKMYIELAKFGKLLLENKSLDKGLSIISDYLKRLKGANRCSIFVHDKDNNILWTIVSDGTDRIVVPLGEGIVGHVYLTKKTIVENDVQNNPYFLKKIDKKNKYKTHNMLTCPIIGHNNKTIGVLQLLNKLDGFSEEDLEFLDIFTRFISSYIELNPYYNQWNE